MSLHSTYVLTVPKYKPSVQKMHIKNPMVNIHREIMHGFTGLSRKRSNQQFDKILSNKTLNTNKKVVEMAELTPLTWWRQNDKIMYTDENCKIHEASKDVWQEGNKMFHLCKALTTNAIRGKVCVWYPRKPNPKVCPCCGYKFENSYVQE